MPNLQLGLSGVTIVLSIRGQPFTLTAPTARVNLGGSGGGGSTPASPSMPDSIRFAYHKPYEESLDLGTPGEVLAAIQEIADHVPSLASPASQALATQWEQLTRSVQGLPVLNQAVTATGNALLTTRVRLTDIEIGFVKFALLSPTVYAVDFTLGLVFVPDPAQMPSFLGAKLTRFGGVVTIAGQALASELGLPA